MPLRLFGVRAEQALIVVAELYALGRAERGQRKFWPSLDLHECIAAGGENERQTETAGTTPSFVSRLIISCSPSRNEPREQSARFV